MYKFIVLVLNLNLQRSKVTILTHSRDLKLPGTLLLNVVLSKVFILSIV